MVLYIMKNNAINEEEINAMNTLNVEGNAQGFDDTTSEASFIGIREEGVNL